MAWIGRYSRGDQVRNIQGLLWQAGVYNGNIDGYFGAKTEAAVRKWQSEVGALADGFWGAKTIDATAQYLGNLNDLNSLESGNEPVVPRLMKDGGY